MFLNVSLRGWRAFISLMCCARLFQIYSQRGVLFQCDPTATANDKDFCQRPGFSKRLENLIQRFPEQHFNQLVPGWNVTGRTACHRGGDNK